MQLDPFFKRGEIKPKEATKFSHEYLRIVEMIEYDGRTIIEIIPETIELVCLVVRGVLKLSRTVGMLLY